MGASCCKGVDDVEKDQDEILDGSGNVKDSNLLTGEQLASKIGRPGKQGRVVIAMDLIETILLEGDEEEEEEEAAAPELKRVGSRRATGFVTKKQVEAASTKVGAVSFSDTPAVSKDEAEQCQRIKGSKGTGFVTKERLLQALEDLSDDEGAGAASAPEMPKIAPARSKGRKGTGFVTKQKLQKLVATLGEEDAE